MQSASTHFSELDNLAIAALTPAEPDDTFVEIEIQREEVIDGGRPEWCGSAEELAVTGRFHRLSMPYEKIEITPVRDVDRRTYARTVKMPLATSAEGAWFDLPEAALIAIEEPVKEPPVAAWRWLAISVAACALAIPAVWALCHALPSLLG
jgi:hypothetical protein